MIPGDAWEKIRYRTLDAVASKSRVAGERYACMAAAVEARMHPERLRIARDRIARAFDLEEDEAERIFRRCLISEAREEADTAWLLRSRAPLGDLIRVPGAEPADSGPAIYVSLHFGSPIVTFLYLRAVRGIQVRAIGRPLGASNPLSGAKRAWGERKVDWVSRCSRTTFVGVDAAGAVEAREELLAGNSLFAVIDVPADVVARSTRFDLFGESILLAGGVLRLAQITGVPLVPVTGRRDGRAIEIEYDTPIPQASGSAVTRSVNAWMLRTLERHPDEWWLWPFVNRAAEPPQQSGFR